MESCKDFADIVKAMSYKGKSSAPLSNLTFFLGAGFSKSWDSRFPVGNELFSFSEKEWQPHAKALEEYLVHDSRDKLGLDITPGVFKDLVYQVGMLKKYPAIRPRFVDDCNIAVVEAELRSLVYEKFRRTAPLYYFNEATEKIELHYPLSSGQQSIRALFNRLLREADGSQGVSEGIRVNFVTTNYDFTVEGILDSCYAPDDTLDLYTYRGVTPIRTSGKKPLTYVYDYWLTNNLLKINGGFEIFKCQDGWSFDYKEKSRVDIVGNPPQIMLPSREQDYLQPYFQAIFPKVVRLLQETKVLVLVGYSLPEEDALLRLLLKQFAEDPNDGDKKLLFYVDICSEDNQIKQISGVFPHAANPRGLTVIPYSGSFSAWAGDVLKRI